MTSEGKAPSGFALLARRISSWTTNCVLSALILVAGLAFGRQVLDWWATDQTGTPEPPPQLAMTDGLGDPTRGHRLQFADAPWAMGRETVVGALEDVAKTLQASCRELTVASDPPNDAPGPSEARFLASLVGESPVAEEPGQWQVYQVEAGFPMVAGVRTASGGSAQGDGEQVAQKTRRVVTWGLAVPAADQAWTLYTFYPANTATGPTADFAEVPLPPDSRKTVSIRAVGGGTMVAFGGPPEPTAWKAFFDRWFQERRWTTVGSWKRSGSTWHLRYARTADRRTEMIDVQFGPDGRGRLAGLLMIAPADSTSTESENQ
jgi:hypothetical protein